MIVEIKVGRLSGRRPASGWTRLVGATAAFLTLFGSFLAVMAADPDGPAPFVAAAVVLFGYLLVGRLVVHEGGHLLAAALARLPVTAVRLRLTGSPSLVEVDWTARRRWLPVRLFALAAGGPLAELLLAAGAYQWFGSVDGSAQRASLLTVTVAAAVSALQNLVPQRLDDGLASDGASMLRSLRPSRAARLRAHLSPVLDTRTRDAPPRFATAAQLDRLRAVIDRGRDPAAVGAAALALLAAYTSRTSTPIAADARRLANVARSANVDRAVAADLAGRLAWARSCALLRDVVLLNTPPSPQRVTAAAELAELGRHLDPTAPSGRYILAMARLWQDRAAEAAELCRDADQAGPDVRPTGLLVRALVQLWSTGDAEAAGPLLREAVRAGCPPGLAWLAGRLPAALDAGHASRPLHKR